MYYHNYHYCYWGSGFHRGRGEGQPGVPGQQAVQLHAEGSAHRHWRSCLGRPCCRSPTSLIACTPYNLGLMLWSLGSNFPYSMHTDCLLGHRGVLASFGGVQESGCWLCPACASVAVFRTSQAQQTGLQTQACSPSRTMFTRIFGLHMSTISWLNLSTLLLATSVHWFFPCICPLLCWLPLSAVLLATSVHCSVGYICPLVLPLHLFTVLLATSIHWFSPYICSLFFGYNYSLFCWLHLSTFLVLHLSTGFSPTSVHCFVDCICPLFCWLHLSTISLATSVHCPMATPVHCVVRLPCHY